MDLFLAHAGLDGRNPLGFRVVSLDLAVELLNLQVLGFHRLADVLEHGVHLLHLLAHRLHLLLRGLECRIVLVGQQLGIDGLGKPCGHLLRARPVHVLDKQVAGHRPQLRVALQQLAHGVQRLLTLGHVAWAGRHRHVVLADAGVVDFLDDNPALVLDLLDRHGLRRVDHRLVSLPVHADDARNALGVVDLGDHVHQLPRGVPNRPRQIVHIVVGAGVGLLLAGQDGAARTLVAGCTQTGVVLPGRTLDVV